MNFTVVNKEIQVGNIDIVAVSTSAVFIIGDAMTISMASAFDTPPESLIIGPFVPLATRG